MYSYPYPRPALTVDCVLFGLDQADLKVLLIQRNLDPFKGQWALPGGFVRCEETLEEAALRELREETGVENVFLEQLYTFGGLDRDPRERVVSVGYYALINLDEHPLQAATDAEAAAWFPLNQVPSLAFDHDHIFATALRRLQGKLRYEPIGFELLPAKFTLTQLQQLYEKVLNQVLDKRNFRKKILKMNLLIPLAEKQQNVRHRAAQLYQFDADRYQQLKEKGFNFEL
jgi:8-oxo-dGTP diphosphatase